MCIVDYAFLILKLFTLCILAVNHFFLFQLNAHIILGKVTLLQAQLWPGGGVEVYHYSSKTSVLEGGEWSAARPGHTLLPGKAQYPLYRRLGGPQGQSGRAENLAPTGITYYRRWPDNVLHVQQPSTYEKPEAASAVLGS